MNGSEDDASRPSGRKTGSTTDREDTIPPTLDVHPPKSGGRALPASFPRLFPTILFATIDSHATT